MPSGREHELAKIRAAGFGMWVIRYVVIGYEEEFEMVAPGKWEQPYAEMKTKVALANMLKRPLRDVIVQSAVKEGP